MFQGSFNAGTFSHVERERKRKRCHRFIKGEASKVVPCIAADAKSLNKWIRDNVVEENIPYFCKSLKLKKKKLTPFMHLVGAV